VASLSSYIGVDASNATLNSGRLLIELKALLFGHGHHPLDRGRADTALRGLAIEHIAGGGYRNVGEAGDVGQFQQRVLRRVV